MRPALIPLVKARALIADPAKWGKGPRGGGYERGPCTFCAAEAIEESSPNLAARNEAYRTLEKSIGVPTLALTLVEWNDARERTHAEVLAAFDKAIEAAA